MTQRGYGSAATGGKVSIAHASEVRPTCMCTMCLGQIGRPGLFQECSVSLYGVRKVCTRATDCPACILHAWSLIQGYETTTRAWEVFLTSTELGCSLQKGLGEAIVCHHPAFDVARKDGQWHTYTWCTFITPFSRLSFGLTAWQCRLPSSIKVITQSVRVSVG
jgi:hypothetical protein